MSIILPMTPVSRLTIIIGLLAVTFPMSGVVASDNEGVFRFYEHHSSVAHPQRTRRPRLSAAHAISLSTDLDLGFTRAEREQIRALGPWLTADGISGNAQVLIRHIQDARIHGLDPETYELSSIVKIVDLLAHLDQWASTGPASLPGQRLSADQALKRQLNALLDTNFVKLVEHLGQGVVNGRELQSRLYRDAPKVNAFNLLVSISSADLSVSQALSSSMPTHPAYQRLTRTMRDLLTEQSTRVSRTRVNDTNESRLIMQAVDKQAIRERLLETGDLSFDGYMAANPDAELVNALRAFQARHGLDQSSFADKRTRAALNTSVEQDIRAVALSLERWRWLPRDLGDRHLFVNIPDYRVKLIEDGKTRLSMAAVVGRFEHQTPAFTRDMSYMEFNPTWTVPASIAQKSLLPKERASPGYLVSREFDFLKRVGQHLITVPASTVTREDFNAANFPYVLHQRGGPMNALGRMKFLMPNQYAIYMHDTQAKKHFTLNDRAYSHGCIRVSDPEALAEQLMLGDGYSEARLERSLQSTETHRIRFRNPIPTHLLYLTTWVDEDNVLQKRPDIYRNDARLTAALQSAGTLLSSEDKAVLNSHGSNNIAQADK